MQIKEIVIYNKKGQKRILKIKEDEVNIITGKSGTGKSSLIDIVEYCLGRSSCKIPKGVIRNHASWYGVLLTHREENIFVARENPPGIQKSTQFAYIERGKNVESPENIPQTNSTNDEIAVTLSEILGISPNKNFPKMGHTRNPLSANIKHSSFLCFQKKEEIDSSQVMFHRQAEQGRIQDIKDTLPYFLGAIREDELALKHELEKEERLLRIAEITLKEAEMLKGDEISQSISLVEEAIDCGIIKSEIKNESQTDRTKILEKVSIWRPGKPTQFNDNLEILQDEANELTKKLSLQDRKIRAAESFANELTGFSSEMLHQKNRLDSIGIFEHLSQKNKECPFCKGELEHKIPEIESIKNTLKDLDEDLEYTIKERPQLRKKISNLKRERETIHSEIQQKLKDIEGVIQSRQGLLEERDLRFRQAQVSARAKFWLDNVRLTDETSQLKIDVKKRSEKVQELRRELDEEKKQQRLNSILNRIGEKMTRWARELKLEHSEFPVRINMSTANIIIDSEEGSIALDEIGSSENLLGYHLVTFFALHEYLRNHKRPVPGFLFLDQPSQVYFPKDTEFDDMKEVLDEDRENVLKIYKFIFKRTKEIPEFQVIITDHADINDKKFQSVINERWRDGMALIPREWIEG
ncbi:DUF3732 domain-containing protein [Nitrosopumilus adriaticus]|uniref:Rad50/SbcC-type AAA domain-containing protein n=1 Tax=Nitrosopumilus adriaticus TaxID=1580092 RepID=A0A0D5C3T6_9ARCH|nr:DUF3732 domain-containing protein [Nitrosopumilus adriaticus]AJW71228.1 hypothetical protein NADRNF5_1547 [Nitrosopumilus adriaticus]